MNRLKQIWSNLRPSFWFVPSLIVAVSIALAVALVEVGSNWSDRWLDRWPLLFGAGAEALESEPALYAGKDKQTKNGSAGALDEPPTAGWPKPVEGE